MASTATEQQQSNISVAESQALIDQFSSNKVTQKACKEFVNAHGIHNIGKEALKSVYNPEDAPFTFRLLSASVALAKAAGKKTLMNQHTKAAVDAYEEMGEALGEETKSVTKTGLRNFAKEKGAEKISGKAIDHVFNKADPVATMAKWRAACLLHNEQAIASTKTLTLVNAQAAEQLFETFKPVYDYEVEEGDSGATDMQVE